jgi:GAF domain-containing protein
MWSNPVETGGREVLSDELARVDLSSTDLVGLTGLICSEAIRLLGATRVAVWVYRPSMHKLVLPEEGSHHIVSLPNGRPIPQEPVVWSSESDDVLKQLITESFGAASNDGTHAVLCVPLRVAAPPCGLLLIEFPSEQAPDEPLGIGAFAAQAAVAVANLEALAVARRHERELQALYETAGELSSNLRLEIVLQAIVDRARTLIGSDVSYITLSDESTQTIYMRVTSGVRRPSFNDIRLNLGEGLGGLVAKEWRAIYTSDYLNDARFRHRPEVDEEVREEGIKSILGVPMRVGGKTIGVLYVANRGVTSFTDADVSLLSSLADHAAMAIENARLFEQAKDAADRMNEANDLIRNQLHRLEHTESVHRQLTELVLGGEGLEAIARVISQLIGRSLMVVDANLRLLAAAGDSPDPFGRKLRRSQRIPAECLEDVSFAQGFREGRGLRPARVRPSRPSGSLPRLLTPVVAKGEVLGYFLVPADEEEPTEEMEVVLEQAARVAALEMLKERSVVEIEERTRGEFLEELLAERPPPRDVLRKRGSQLGMNLDRVHRVLVFQVDEPSGGDPGAALLGRRARQLLAVSLREAAGASFAAERRDIVIGLIPEDSNEGRLVFDGVTLAEKIKAQVEREEPGADVTAIVTAPCRSFAEYRREVRLAEKALHFFTEIERVGIVVELGRLGLVPILLEEKSREEIEESVERVLGPLLEYDAQRGTSLVDTLEAYFLSLGNAARAAERCHVHLNSVYYRLERIREVLSRDFEQPEIALDLQVALRARRLLAGAD